MKLHTITLVGVGGVGHLLVPALREFQPDELILVDMDVFEEKNLTRQPLSRGNLHKYKTDVMRETYADETYNITGYPATFKDTITDPTCTIPFSDLIIAAVDNNNARNSIRDYCIDHQIPMIYCGNENTSGQAHLLYPENFNTPIDPWVIHPELNEDGKSSPESCSRNPNDQTYATNVITAAAVLHLLRLHTALNFKPVSGVPSSTYYTLKQFTHKHPHA